MKSALCAHACNIRNVNWEKGNSAGNSEIICIIGREKKKTDREKQNAAQINNELCWQLQEMMQQPKASNLQQSSAINTQGGAGRDCLCRDLLKHSLCLPRLLQISKLYFIFFIAIFALDFVMKKFSINNCCSTLSDHSLSVHSQVSYFSTSPELSNKQRFEYFSRTIPSDHYQVKAMVEIVKSMGWTYVSIIYEESNYGIKVSSENIFSSCDS